ncbi:uncharacterized protein AMSG_02100 [Thecamonas trahens ATCC 50062]|uniref:Uncharacterized protein n=1 Tax=Thecamonas trahens ATCC 50062 TaxID=461836 RepID=A0A0L0DVB1_THETB|nr:hypothetical protein AMSG_02100 [Thecamonas trahens ATCC 50062]KNC56087.1 hypothetical protein AMSG_02100 [Thecamonas trahens ATCC 50062]|eukprot:XP_013761129.1 hypothetical protein AMSG_02100 [Thecamonas trahens ATCC 50062]
MTIKQAWVLVLALTAANLMYAGYVAQLHAAILREPLTAPRVEGSTTTERTLVVYAYYENIDLGYRDNAAYFLRHGVLAGSADIDFVIVISGEHTLDSLTIRPSQRSASAILGAPDSEWPINAPNVLFVTKDNRCYDFGAYAFGLDAAKEWKPEARYTKFVLINSSVRGPFLPRYITEAVPAVPWTSWLTSRVTGSVKLVGTSINCQCYAVSDEHDEWPPPATSDDTAERSLVESLWSSLVSVADTLVGGGKHGSETRCLPHVQSMVLATDVTGLAAMRRASVFECHSKLAHVVFYSEIGASKAIYDAGYDVSSLMLKYAGSERDHSFSWREQYLSGSASCNRGANPTLHSSYDGRALDALEVMFVKAKKELSPGYNTVAALSRYALAIEVAADSELGVHVRDSNAMVDDKRIAQRIRDAFAAEARAAADCSLDFDDAFYLAANHDVAEVGMEPYMHWQRDGFFEGRRFRWKAPTAADEPGTAIGIPRKCEPLLRTRMFHGIDYD